MNRATMKTYTARFAGDASQQRYSGLYEDTINRAQEQFALDSRALWKDTSWSHASGSSYENLPSDFMYEDWVSWDGAELSPISRHDLNRLNPGHDWSVDTATTPTHYIVDPEQATKRIVLYPIPSDAKTLAMRYYPIPAEMTADTDTPLNSSALMIQFHLGICGFAAWLLLNGETSITPELQEKMKINLALYNDAVEKAVGTFKNTASQPLRIRGGRLYK